MTIRDVMEITGARSLTGEDGLERTVTGGYAGDLLSRVMAQGAAGMAWITVQTHMNAVAVAVFTGAVCMIVAEDRTVAAEVAAKAEEEGVALLASPKTAYELAGLLYAGGLREIRR